MYPYTLFLGMTAYDLCVIGGVALAFFLFIRLADKKGVCAKLQLLVVIGASLAVFLGFVFATLTQSFYNYLSTGVFRWEGMTFYGGLVGGALVFFAVYFIAGRRVFAYDKGGKNAAVNGNGDKKPHKDDKDVNAHKREFFTVVDILVCALCFGHAVGRLGCLFAGCCHGKLYAESRPFTLPVRVLSVNGDLLYTRYAVPVQLFEAAFLCLLGVFLTVRVVKGKRYGLSFYCFLYGVWRFLIEFARGDDRGATVISFLSPSQLTALFLIAFSVFFVLSERRRLQKEGQEKTSDNEAKND